MGIPPTRPSSTPSSPQGSEGPKKDKSRKDFKLPEKQRKEEEEGKKKSLFEIAGERESEKQIQSDIQGDDLKISEKTSGIEAKAQVSQIGRLIQQMVSNLQVGTIGGKEFASLTLAKTSDVPLAFAGSKLTLSYGENGLSIQFSNFSTPQQEQLAVNLVEQNKEQLSDMVQALQAKNITVSELNVAGRQIALPRVEPLPPPFQPPPATQAESEQGRREGGREESGSEGGPR